MASAEQATKFLDALATAAYDLRTKYNIPQEDLILAPVVRIDQFITNDEAFKNVSKQ